MQIGNPTDVKHVAHIGWDGPSVNTPSWVMKCSVFFFFFNKNICLEYVADKRFPLTVSDERV